MVDSREMHSTTTDKLGKKPSKTKGCVDLHCATFCRVTTLRFNMLYYHTFGHALQMYTQCKILPFRRVREVVQIILYFALQLARLWFRHEANETVDLGSPCATCRHQTVELQVWMAFYQRAQHADIDTPRCCNRTKLCRRYLPFSIKSIEVTFLCIFFEVFATTYKRFCRRLPRVKSL